MKKVMILFGTRPEAIKMAPLIYKLKERNFKVVTVISSQHREMLEQVLRTFDISYDYDLKIFKENQDIYYITSSVINGLKDILKKEKPDILLVHGDTTTTFAGALSAFYSKIKIGHVEAGLRTYNKFSPFPEEMNRKLVDSLSDFHFAPTNKARENLINEGIDIKNIFVTGNTVIDALILVKERLLPKYETEIENFFNEKIKEFNGKKLILITQHRRENFGKNFDEIFKALKKLSEKYKNFNFVYPVHLNPNVRKQAFSILKDISNFYFIEPVDYVKFVYLMLKSYIIITDSGGIQEEAPAFGKPVLVTRDTTERPEAVEFGTVKLAGTKMQNIVETFESIADDNKNYQKMANATNPYGDGTASEKIADILGKFL
jgi:UDP-N-acetylglucosamine 2-epimerase (non-hydrolysing)